MSEYIKIIKSEEKWFSVSWLREQIIREVDSVKGDNSDYLAALIFVLSLLDESDIEEKMKKVNERIVEMRKKLAEEKKKMNDAV